jgi:hypothetical protein
VKTENLLLKSILRHTDFLIEGVLWDRSSGLRQRIMDNIQRQSG